MVGEEDVELTCDDGYVLRGNLFYASGGTEGECSSSSGSSTSSRPVVVISCATGVRRRFYVPFARYLASLGCAALVYDFRGIGDSFALPKSKLNDEDAKVSLLKDTRLRETTIRHHWGVLDQTAALQFMINRYPSRELVLVGHSLGGHICGLSPLRSAIKRVVFVSVNNANHRYARNGLARWVETKLVIPLATRLCGYLPTGKLGMFENLPKEAALQWAKWSRHEDYLFSDAVDRALYACFETKILSLSFADDEFGVKSAMENFLSFFPRCTRKLVHTSPEAIGVKKIGHNGFFFSEFKEALWRPLVEQFVLTGDMKSAKLRSRL
mmetsp:Transcript_25016/g.48869  ORF Transcript_25016/g.48869 Transcript_25016/m.48869 type:complete len:325 (-) Transcript_25016:14-988(-)